MEIMEEGCKDANIRINYPPSTISAIHREEMYRRLEHGRNVNIQLD